MDLACCQLDIAWEDKPANYRRAEALLDAAALPAGSLVLLPEMFATGFTMNASPMAEPIDGPTPRFLADLARKRGLYLIAGAVVSDSGSARPRNEALVFGPEGRLLTRYAKMHLFSFAGEPDHYSPGQSPTSFAWHQATVAPSICYDLRFPELFRAATAQGAQIITVIACWPAPREEHWLALLRARAIENQCYIAAVNRCGKDPSGLTYGGRSQIIDPRGAILADAGPAESVIRAAVDLEALRNYRRDFPAQQDRRIRSL